MVSKQWEDIQKLADEIDKTMKDRGCFYIGGGYNAKTKSRDLQYECSGKNVTINVSKRVKFVA